MRLMIMMMMMVMVMVLMVLMMIMMVMRKPSKKDFHLWVEVELSQVSATHRCWLESNQYKLIILSIVGCNQNNMH